MEKISGVSVHLWARKVQTIYTIENPKNISYFEKQSYFRCVLAEASRITGPGHCSRDSLQLALHIAALGLVPRAFGSSHLSSLGTAQVMP
uniref:Uncharacterized protein n=1 Tax=Trichogramma kaykai TaxID=54128 RepID=A0ABD2WY15_9HYME